ncbi:Glucooligosaccharide oxidase [Xylaria bambusicola]|uniref:Glucooligosaccharide oxidase n=1 Tax=Xylaria bambusicola TaxID=326684 RepID=UPI002008C8D5|nr:Glucooligosaccharide oxidase [Xylaria bambusicola]KAI0521218.1 Glucooligosaccharide oxidase [Xylaria bambusicola]
MQSSRWHYMIRLNVLFVILIPLTYASDGPSDFNSWCRNRISGYTDNDQSPIARDIDPRVDTFDLGCTVSTEAITSFGGTGTDSVNCNTAAEYASVCYDICSEDASCRFASKQDTEDQGLESNALRACALASFLVGPDQVVWGSTGSPEHTALAQVNWSKDCWKAPRCILRPSSTEDVSRIVKIISRTSTKFAIRSGGHNPNPGWGSIGEDGVLVDLSRLDKIQVSGDAQTLALGPGRRWIDVYKALEGTGRTVLGGRTPDVGVGGLLLGGGIPSFSSEYGLACDYVQRYKVVLGNGTIALADRDTNRDLFWALKGGGANFGIVTEFELETVPVDKIWYESRIYGPGESRNLLTAVREYQEHAEEDPRASFAFSLSSNHTIVAFIYSEPVEYPDVFSMFYDIPYERHFIKPTLGTPYTLAAAFEKVLGERPAYKRDIVAVSTLPDLKLYEEAYDRWLEISSDAMARFDCMMTFGIQPVTSSAVKKSMARGNPLTFVPESQQWYTSVIQWQDDNYDDIAHEAIKASGEGMRSAAQRKGLLLDFIFMNDATWDQDPLSSYGEESVAELIRISHEYDSSQFFQNLQADGFLLRKIGQQGGSA